MVKKISEIDACSKNEKPVFILTLTLDEEVCHHDVNKCRLEKDASCLPRLTSSGFLSILMALLTLKKLISEINSCSNKFRKGIR